MPLNSMHGRIKLTREELYELIWGEAMTKVAARFQMSDVALRKRCIKHRIPLPGRGYWRKVETGVHPKRIALPQQENAKSIVFSIQPIVAEDQLVSGVDQAFLDYEAANPIVIGTGRARLHEITQAILRDLKGQKPDDYGAIRSSAPDTFQVRLHPSSKDRVIAIIDALTKACHDRGFTIQHGKAGNRRFEYAGVVIDGILLQPVLDERMQRKPYQMTAEEVARRQRGGFVYTPTYTYEPTGELTLNLGGTYGIGLQTSWKDTRRQKIESRLNEVIIGMRALADHRLEEQRKAAERKRRYDLIQEQRAELRQQIALERKAVEELEHDAEAWARAQKLREYIAAAEHRYA